MQCLVIWLVMPCYCAPPSSSAATAPDTAVLCEVSKQIQVLLADCKCSSHESDGK